MLEFDISENNLDFLCVAETRLTKNTESLYSIERYNSFYNSRETRGGGTAVFVRNRYSASKIVNLCFTTAALESTFVYISDGSLSLVIGCFYRPPSAGIREFMLKIEDVLSYIRDNYRSKIVVHGDFNIDAFKGETSASHDFLTLMSTYGMLPVILRPTRVSTHSASLIDNIFISRCNDFTTSGVINSLISDHFAVFVSFSKCGRTKDCSSYVEVERRKINDLSLATLKSSLENCDWERLKGIQDAECAYSEFAHVISDNFDACCPVVSYKVKKNDIDKPYITTEIKALIRQKHKVQRKYSKSPVIYGSEFRAIRNRVKSAIRSAKSQFYKQRLEEGCSDGKKTWNTINSILGRGKTVKLPDKFFINNVWIYDPLTIANKANEYFCGIGERLASNFAVNDEFLKYMPNTINSNF